MKKLQVKECKVKNEKAYGITDGKKWFFYAYKTRERAESMLPGFDTPMKVEVNVSQPIPFKISDLS